MKAARRTQDFCRKEFAPLSRLVPDGCKVRKLGKPLRGDLTKDVLSVVLERYNEAIRTTPDEKNRKHRKSPVPRLSDMESAQHI